MVAVWAGRTCQPEAAWQRGRPATRQTSGNLTGNLPPGLRDRPTALAHRRAILAAMYAAAVKHLGGISQLLGSILMLQEVLAFACDQGELVKPVAWLHAQAATATVALWRLLRRPRQVISLAEGGTATDRGPLRPAHEAVTVPSEA